MIVVSTYLNKSEIHGFGIFARDFISKGNKVWEYNPTFDIRFTEEEFEALPSATRQEVEIHLYQPEQGGLLYYEAIMGKYMNHSCEPDVDFSDIGNGWATRDIQSGEELACAYRHFMADGSHIPYL